MKHPFFAALAASALFLGGCQNAAVKPAEPKPAQAPAAELSADARQALAQAEADVKEAQAKGALWTTAQDALKKAREAATKNDSEAVIKAARTASEQARLGIAQTRYPLTTP
jgi:murein lipoprotein